MSNQNDGAPENGEKRLQTEQINHITGVKVLWSIVHH